MRLQMRLQAVTTMRMARAPSNSIIVLHLNRNGVLIYENLGSALARIPHHGPKNVRGAEAFSAFSSVIQTAVKRGASSTFDALHNLFGPKTTAASSTDAHAP